MVQLDRSLRCLLTILVLIGVSGEAEHISKVITKVSKLLRQSSLAASVTLGGGALVDAIISCRFSILFKYEILCAFKALGTD